MVVKNRSEVIAHDDQVRHEELLGQLKVQIKALMEESVTKKFVHEESAPVLRLCGTVELCLLDGLRRRTAGFLKNNKIASLYIKVGKTIPAVNQLVAKIEEIESNAVKSQGNGLTQTGSNGNGVNRMKYLWVRVALTSKLLDRIIEHLVDNNSKYYEKTSIMANPVYGTVLSSLLVGPCALDFTKIKTHDHYWSDPPAGELLQRHKLNTVTRNPPRSPGKRPPLSFRTARHKSSSDSLERSASFREYVESLHQNNKIPLLYGKNNVIVQPQEDVGPIPGYLSLHQQANCVIIKWTPNQLMDVKEGATTASSFDENGEVEVQQTGYVKQNSVDGKSQKSSYWEFAISVDISDIVYLHCHQQANKGGTIVLVGQDGVQWPPIRFPKGGHMLAFLSCLETGLLPHGSLDPPLWPQKGKGKVFPRLRKKSSHRSNSTSSEESTDFVFRVNTSSDSSYVPPPSGRKYSFDLMQSFLTFPQMLKNELRPSGERVTNEPPSSTIPRTVVIHDDSTRALPVVGRRHYVQGPCRCRRCVKLARRQQRRRKASRDRPSSPVVTTPGTLDSSDCFVPNLDMYTWDQNQPRHYDHPDAVNGTAFSEGSYAGSSIKVLCDTMRRQIISRAFYGWLAHCRHLATVRTHLSALVNCDVVMSVDDSGRSASVGVNDETWALLRNDGKLVSRGELMRYVYFGGVAHDLRPQVWLYLLGHYPESSTEEERKNIDLQNAASYEEIVKKWTDAEQIIKERDQSTTPSNLSKQFSSISSGSTSSYSDVVPPSILRKQSSVVSDVFSETGSSGRGKFQDKFEVVDESSKKATKHSEVRFVRKQKSDLSESSHVPYSSISSMTSFEGGTTWSMKSISLDELPEDEVLQSETRRDHFVNATGSTSDEEVIEDDFPPKSVAAIYTDEFLDLFSLNLHRVEKDVHRCDRTHWYFAQAGNLDKLRNVMCSYVWENVDTGYMQGMCDLAAPLLVVLDDEALVYSCFKLLMVRMGKNFPNGGAMDSHFANMRSLIQIMDGELFEHMHKNGDYTHFYFCYRWFLLDFKRELSYDDDVFMVWEKIWSARHCSSHFFFLFFALAMLKTYRDVILENDMDFTDIIKFFNEMAEKHDALNLIDLARRFVADVQQMIHK